MALYGPQKYDMNVMLYYACGARDFKTADLLIDKIGNDWNFGFWQDQDHVDSMRIWVRQWRVITGLAHG